MIFLNELKDGILYKKPSYLPIDQKNKKTGSAVFLLTPNYDSSKKIMESEIILQKYFESYFIEKDITYYINQENALVRRSDEVVTEGFFSKPKVQKYKESELLEDYKNVKKKLAEKKFVILDRNDPLHDVINSYKENYLWANDIPCRYLLYSDDKNNTFLPIMTFTDSFDPNNSHPYAYFIGCKKNNVKNKVFLYCIYSEGEDKASIGDTIDIQFKYTTNTNESFIIESSIPKLNEVIKLNKKLNEYEYGFIVDGKITDDFENFWRDYRTISPKDFEKNKGGVCWDYVEYQNTQLTKMGLSCFTYYIELNDKMSSTHTFTVISADKIIYIESAYGKIQGVWEARS
ncbi:MAG: hypothetical protein M0P49_03870, partial [Bacilli bacterium]|nr:hypothetical protein [Bacilli bacterium]